MDVSIVDAREEIADRGSESGKGVLGWSGGVARSTMPGLAVYGESDMIGASRCHEAVVEEESSHSGQVKSQFCCRIPLGIR